MTRRNFLQSWIMAHLVAGRIQAALAQTKEVELRNYVQIGMHGAPNRFCFDHFLKTRDSESMIQNPMVHTQFGGGAPAGDPVYALEKHTRADGSTLLIPPLWNRGLRTSAGIRQPHELLANMITIRGYGTGVDGHPTNAVRQTLPSTSQISIAGLAAQYSTRLFHAVSFPYNQSFSGFRSPTRRAPVTLRATAEANLVELLLDPFRQRPETSPLFGLRSRYADLMDHARHFLQTAFQSDPTTQRFSRDLAAEATKQISKGVSGLNENWGPTYNRYHSLVHEAARRLDIQGLSSQPLVNSKKTDRRFSLSATELRTPILDPGYDIRSGLATWSCNGMAQMFAFLEHVLKENLVTSLEVGGYMLTPRGITIRTQGATHHVIHSFDEHLTGSYCALMLDSAFFRALSTGLMELTAALQEHAAPNGKTVFENTVIHLTSEFGRSPREDGSGSDHGFNAMITSLLSGAIQGGPYVLGNILRTGLPGTAYSGTWGLTAPTKVGGANVNMNPAYVAATVSELLGSPHNPWANIAQPLAKIESGNLVLNTEPGGIVG